MAGYRLAPKAAQARRNPTQRRRLYLGTGTASATYAESSTVATTVEVNNPAFGGGGVLGGPGEFGGLFDGYHTPYTETSSHTVTTVAGRTGGASGGLFFLFGAGEPNDTYSTTVTFPEASTVTATVTTTGTDGYPVYAETSSIAVTSTLTGTDAYYSTSTIYAETSSASATATTSSADNYTTNDFYETSTIAATITLTSSDTINLPPETSQRVGRVRPRGEHDPPWRHRGASRLIP